MERIGPRNKIRTADKEKPRIRISINPSLANADYTVGVNPVGFYQLFRDIGLSDEAISRLKVNLEPRDLTEKVWGSFSIRSGVVTIYTDWLWKKWERASTGADSITEGRRPLRDPFKKVLITKRMPSYLKHAPKDRGKKFSEKLITQGVTRLANEVVLHESMHATEDPSSALRSVRAQKMAGRIVGAGTALILANDSGASLDNPSELALAIISGVLAGSAARTITYHFSPHEMSARRFASRNGFNPRYRDLIVFGPTNEKTQKRIRKVKAFSSLDIYTHGAHSHHAVDIYIPKKKAGNK